MMPAITYDTFMWDPPPAYVRPLDITPTYLPIDQVGAACREIGEQAINMITLGCYNSGRMIITDRASWPWDDACYAALVRHETAHRFNWKHEDGGTALICHLRRPK